MFQDVTLPLWLLLLIVGFAAVTFASHFLFPSVRWFFRKRAERGPTEVQAVTGQVWNSHPGPPR